MGSHEVRRSSVSERLRSSTAGWKASRFKQLLAGRDGNRDGSGWGRLQAEHARWEGTT